jgi:hypothetical protein
MATAHFGLTDPNRIRASTERERIWLGNSLRLNFSSCKVGFHLPEETSFSAQAILNSLLPYRF